MEFLIYKVTITGFLATICHTYICIYASNSCLHPAAHLALAPGAWRLVDPPPSSAHSAGPDDP